MKKRVRLSLGCWLIVAVGLAACASPPAAAPTAAPAAPAPAKPAAAAPTAAVSASPAAKPSAAPSPRAIEKLTLTIPSTGTDFVYAAVADKRGYFREEGISVSFEQAAATVGVQATVAGQYDFTGSVGSSQAAILAGAPLRIVMVAQEHPAYGFFARPGSGIATIKDLKGKKLGVTTIGSAAHILANQVLEKNGLNPETDVTWIPLGSPQNLWSALKAGSVDASMIGTGDLHRPGKEGGYVDLKIYQDPAARSASAGLTTSERLLREKPDVVKRMIRATLKAMQFMKANKQETVPIMAEFLGVSPDDAGILYDLTIDGFIPLGYVDDATLQQSIDVLLKGDNQGKPRPSIAQMFDLRLAKEAAQELQKEGWKP